MKWKTVGVYVGIAACVILLFGIGVSLATTRTFSWNAVTTYWDGVPIESGNSVTYSGWRQDNVTGTVTQIANRISQTSMTFDDSSLIKGRTYNFWVGAFLTTGGASDNSAVYAWVMPLGKASPPQGLLVQ